jgi:hypothetical protein
VQIKKGEGGVHAMVGRWLAVVLAPLAFFAFPALAEAADSTGTLVVSPARAELDAPLSLATVGICERGSAYMVTVDGEGIARDSSSNIIVGAADLRWLEATGLPSHQLLTSVSLERFFQRAGVATPRGDYVITFICRNRLDVEPLQTFAATLVLDGEGGYQAQGMSALDISEALKEARIDFSVVPGSDRVVVTDDYVDDAVPESEQEAVVDSVAGDQNTTGSITFREVLFVGGTLLIVGAGAAFIVMRRREKEERNREVIVR